MSTQIIVKGKGHHPYSIHVVKNPFIWMKEKLNKYDKVCIVTDHQTRKLFRKELSKLKTNKRVLVITFPYGEKNKNLNTVSKIIVQLTTNGITRDSAIIGFGGGQALDVTGFTASIYLRGVDYYQVPTTIHAMSDCTVGGKCCINSSNRKSVCSTHYFPHGVVISPIFYSTHTDSQLRNGIIEILKDAVITDRTLFRQIKKEMKKYLSRNEKMITKIVWTGIKLKARLSRKGMENGPILQSIYGHTFGYAIESYFDFKKYSHPEAVAFGIVLEGALSQYMGHLSGKERAEQLEIIRRFGFETRIKEPIGADRFIEEIRKDKRAGDYFVYFALPAKIGQPIDSKHYLVKVSYNDLSEFLKWFSNDQKDIQFH